jgi:hypothetical protein
VSDWAEQIPVTQSVRLPPDPRVMDAIGGNHAIETALADLIDNAIDAKSSRVLVRFVRLRGRLVALYVVDDGSGMSSEQLTQAMMVGGQRVYEQGDLGHFGWGLKAASLSQADSLTVVSRTRDGVPVGMRWLAEKARTAFECDVVDGAFAASEWGRTWGFIAPQHGTVIRWDRVRTFPSSSDPVITERWLQEKLVAVAQHLGLVFHRFLERSSIEIALDVEDADLGNNGPPNPVRPLNPMGYARSGAADYPRDLEGKLGLQPVHLVAHIWPGRSELPQFRLPGKAADEFQGFYFYRNDRLIQAGGWNGLQVKDRRLQLARVELDVTDDLLVTKAFHMNPEKTRVEVGADFARAVEEARSKEGTDFRSFLGDATTTYKEASRRNRNRERVAPPGRGFAPLVKRAIAEELEFIPGEDPIDIRWVDLPWEVFIDIDRARRIIELNKRYRGAIIGDRKGGLNDAAIVKALVYLLMQNVFRGAFWGSKDKDNIELWQSVLIAAARSDLDE